MGTAAPWASDPVADSPVAPEDASAFPLSATTTAPAGRAAVVSPTTPWTQDAPVDKPISAANPAVVVDPSIIEHHFGDEPTGEPATHLTPEQHSHLITMAKTGASADDMRRYAASIGFAGPDNFNEIVRQRDVLHKGVNANVKISIPQLPDSGITGSAAYGAGDTATAGFLDELGAIPDTLGMTAGRQNLWNSPNLSFGDLYDRNLDINRGILDADQANHPYATVTGEIIGGLAIPTGLEGVGLDAGRAVLRMGGSMREARAMASAAIRWRLAKEGAAYGAAHGAGSADGGLGDRLEGGAVGAAEGAAGGYGLASLAQVAAKYGGPAVDAITQYIAKGGKIPTTTDGAPDYAQLARDLNIERTPATSSKTGISTVVQSGLGALPGGSPVQAATDREAAGLADVARATATDVGDVTNRQGAGEALSEGAKQYKKTSGDEGGALYDQRDALMGGTSAPVRMDNTAQSIIDFGKKFPTSPALAQLNEHPVIRRIQQGLPNNVDNELTLGEATEALSHVRGVYRNLQAKGDVSGVVLGRVGQLKQAMAQDVTDAARAADIAAGREPGAEGSALKAQQDADAFWADRSSALNGALKRPLQSANDDTKVSGEAVYNQVYGDMDSKSGNLARLRETWFRLPTEAKSTFAATAIDDLGRATAGAQNDTGTAWSYQTFLTNLNRLSPQARNIVFGASADKQLGQIAAYASRLRQLDRSRNFSNTAQKYFAGAFMATVGGAIMHGDIGHAVEAAAAIPATWGGAKLFLATPKMRDWTLQAMKALSNGGANSETALKVLTKRLGSIATTDPSIADQALGLQRHILAAVNDNAPQAGRMMAQSPGQGPDNTDQKTKAN